MDEDSACCSPSAGRGDGTVTPPGTRGEADPAALGMLLLPGGEFLMGTDDARGYPADGEGPVHRVSLRPFWIDPLAVTNERFGEFVEATGHVTEAERFGWSFVFAGLLPDDFPETRGVVAAPWWRQVEGAGWRHPEGPQSDLADRADHPAMERSV